MSLWSKVKKMTGQDWIALVKIIVSYLPGRRLRGRGIWLLSERENDARDNGYWLFRYIREKHPALPAYYAIHKSAPDYARVAQLGNIVEFGSLAHHKLTWGCDRFISAHIGNGFPNQHICFNLLLMGKYSFKNIFLQHGITKDCAPFLFSDQNKLDLFCCAADRERDFVADRLGYGGRAQTLGFCRYDNLTDYRVQEKRILIMPTWRYWLYDMNEAAFVQSDYYLNWSNVLNEISSYAKEFEIIFFLHPDLQKFAHLFRAAGITVASQQTYDVQELLKSSARLITDYSSIYFDFAYMNKPLAYFQFDYQQYREKQYPQGYFSYQEDGFGPVCQTPAEVIKYIVEHDCVEEVYQKRVQRFFTFHDQDNCKRTFEAIQTL